MYRGKCHINCNSTVLRVEIFHLFLTYSDTSVIYRIMAGLPSRRNLPCHYHVKSTFTDFLSHTLKFQELLKRPNTLLITTGFSFADNHISQMIIQLHNKSLVALISDYNIYQDKAEFFTNEDRRAMRIRIPIHLAFLENNDENSVSDGYEKAMNRLFKKKMEQYDKIRKLMDDGIRLWKFQKI